MITTLVSDLTIAFIFLIITTAIAVGIFVYWRPLNKIQWKRVDYIWLALTAIGLIGLLENNRQALAEGEQRQNHWIVESSGREIKSKLSTQWVCFKHIKSDLSPQNFDEIERMYQITCEWSNRTMKLAEGPIDNMTKIEGVQKIDVADVQLQEHVSDVVAKIEEYNNAIAQRQSIQENIREGVIASVVNWLSPLILMLGISIRIAKTAGEIEIEKHTKVSTAPSKEKAEMATDRVSYFKFFIFILISILVLSVLYGISVFQVFSGWNQASGTFGDSFGALNAIFSGITISAVVVTILMQQKALSIQKEEFILQRTEMKDTREEFLINRTTTVIYNQLARLEDAIKTFQIDINGQTHRSYDAFFQLHHAKITFYTPVEDDRTVEQKEQERRKGIYEATKLYGKNSIPIAQFALLAYNSATVVKETLCSSTLSIENINNLKNVYFRNIGFVCIGVLEDIQDKFQQYLQLATQDKGFLKNYNVQYGELTTASVFLKPILEFRSTIFSETVLTEIKNNWMSEFGAHA